MKFNFFIATVITAQLSFSSFAFSQAQCDASSLQYQGTKAETLVNQYITSQESRFSELKIQLKEVQKYRELAINDANVETKIGKIYKYIGFAELISELIFPSKNNSFEILDGVSDIIHGSNLEADALKLKLKADGKLQKMVTYLNDEEKLLNNLKSEVATKKCISLEEYTQFASKMKSQALTRVISLEKMTSFSQNQIKKIKTNTNLKVGLKTAGIGALIYLGIKGIQVFNRTDMGLFSIIGIPMMGIAGFGTIGLGAEIYSDLKVSKEDINQIEAVNSIAQKELLQIKSLLESSQK